MIAGHRFVVRSAYDDSHLISSLAVQRIIFVECPAPHRRPNKIGSETKEKFKDTFIETMVAVICSVCMLHPAGKARSLVVQEYSSVTHCRLSGSICSTRNAEIVIMRYRDICPVIPRRYADLLRQLIYAIHSASTVTSHNDKSFVHTLHRILHEPDHILLPVSFQITYIDEIICNHRLYDVRRKRAGNDCTVSLCRFTDFRTGSAYHKEIILKICCSPQHSCVIGR